MVWLDMIDSTQTGLLVIENPLVFIAELVHVLGRGLPFQGDRLSLAAAKSLVVLDFEAL